MGRSLLVVDDHPGIASALTLLLDRATWGPILEAETRSEAIAVAERERPELVSVDLTLGDDDGVELVRQLREAHPHVVLVVLTASGTAEQAVRCLRAGATAFIPKSCQPDEIVTAIEAAAGGDTWLPPDLLGPVIALLLDPPPASEWEELVSTLSAREHAVLELMVAGLDRRAIADELVISLNTVRTHVKNILAKLGVHASLEAVSVALRAGMRPPPSPGR
jgi:DNA-binding NarL/FixJ family response regulator